MKTLKVIKRIWLLVFIYLFLRFIQWCYQNYATNEPLQYFLTVLLIVFCYIIAICLVSAIVFLIIGLSQGDYNDFFSKHTDPVIEKMETFFNRRNIKKND
jgi:hypothetical protein